MSTVVITVSDSRTEKTDESGAILASLLTEAGHVVTARKHVPDEREAIAAAVLAGIESGAQLVALTGGTGLAARDVTIEAVAPLLDKVLDGFGEAFRARSFEEIGPRAMLSRALAGSRGRALVVALPGSPNAVRLGVGGLLLPILSHAVGLLGRSP